MKVLLALGLAATAQAQDLAAILTPEGLTSLGCDLTACAPLGEAGKNIFDAFPQLTPDSPPDAIIAFIPGLLAVTSDCTYVQNFYDALASCASNENSQPSCGLGLQAFQVFPSISFPSCPTQTWFGAPWPGIAPPNTCDGLSSYYATALAAPAAGSGGGENGGSVGDALKCLLLPTMGVSLKTLFYGALPQCEPVNFATQGEQLIAYCNSVKAEIEKDMPEKCPGEICAAASQAANAFSQVLTGLQCDTSNVGTYDLMNTCNISMLQHLDAGFTGNFANSTCEQFAASLNELTTCTAQPAIGCNPATSCSVTGAMVAVTKLMSPTDCGAVDFKCAGQSVEVPEALNVGLSCAVQNMPEGFLGSEEKVALNCTAGADFMSKVGKCMNLLLKDANVTIAGMTSMCPIISGLSDDLNIWGCSEVTCEAEANKQYASLVGGNVTAPTAAPTNGAESVSAAVMVMTSLMIVAFA